MKSNSSYLTIIGILLIIVSLFTGFGGLLTSLTGLGVPPIWLQFILLALWVLALIGLKIVLNTKHKFFKSDMFLYIFLALTIVNFFIRSYHQILLTNKPLEFFAFLVMVLTPVSALLFYISILKAKNLWFTLYGAVGIFISFIGLIEQGAIYFLASSQNPSGYVNQFVIGRMIGGATVSLIKIALNWLLGGILISGGMSKTK